MIEDFLARTGLQRCQTFAETAEVISKVRSLRRLSLLCAAQNRPALMAPPQVAFKTFLNITPTISYPAPSAPPPPGPGGQTLPQPSEFILTLDDNPLSEFAELPRDAREGGLWFSNVLCGVIRGALEMVSCWPAPFGEAMCRDDEREQIQMQVETRFLSDALRGDGSTELYVRLIRIMDEEQPENDE